MKHCFVLSRLDDNLNRYSVTVHKTEVGAAKAILEAWYGGDMDVFWQIHDEKLYDEQFPDGITEGEVYEKALQTAAEKVVSDYHGDRTMRIWDEEQEYGYEIECFAME